VATDGLTDAQLRASAVPVSGDTNPNGLTDSQLRAAPVICQTSRPLTIGQLYDIASGATAYPGPTPAGNQRAYLAAILIKNASAVAASLYVQTGSNYLIITPPVDPNQWIVIPFPIPLSGDLATQMTATVDGTGATLTVSFVTFVE
jgi:hypothetical protein